MATETLPAHYLRALASLRAAISAPSAIAAGGWLRDIFTGDDPRDVDVFVESADFEAVRHELSCASWLDCEPVEFPHAPEHALECSSGSCVENVLRVHGLLPIEVQIIAVENPTQWVSLFDAPCNMLYVSLHDLQASLCAPPIAIEHAKARRWEQSDLAQECDEVLAQRAEKFRARGYAVVRPEPPWTLAELADLGGAVAR